MNKYIAAITVSLLTLASSSLAFADCEEMGDDNWNELSLQMANAYEAGDLEDALTAAKRLTLICNRSPVVNFTMSEIYRRMDDDQSSYTYVKKATDYIQEYPVPQALAERIWMRRAEFELPYKKQLEDLQKQLETGTGEYGSRLKQTDDDLILVSTELLNLQEQNVELIKSQRSILYTTKWIGAGTAIGGAALAAVGAGLLGANYHKAKDQYGVKWNEFDKKDAKVHGGIALLAGGLGLGLAGSAIAIYSQIKLIRLESANSDVLDNASGSDASDGENLDESTENSEETQASTVNFNFDVSPNAVVFGMTF